MTQQDAATIDGIMVRLSNLEAEHKRLADELARLRLSLARAYGGVHATGYRATVSAQV
jgi:hypothetical protein